MTAASVGLLLDADVEAVANSATIAIENNGILQTTPDEDVYDIDKILEKMDAGDRIEYEKMILEQGSLTLAIKLLLFG